MLTIVKVRVPVNAAVQNCFKPGSWIHWRPNPTLPEQEQYALVKEVREISNQEYSRLVGKMKAKGATA
jgi:hypothetical protein